MALSDSVLKGLILAELQNVFDVQDISKAEKFAEAVAKAVVAHITSDAEVEVTGVTSGSSTAPGTIS